MGNRGTVRGSRRGCLELRGNDDLYLEKISNDLGEQPAGLWRNLLRKCKIGPFYGEFSLNIPDIRLKFAAKWPQFINISLRFPKSDRLLGHLH